MPKTKLYFPDGEDPYHYAARTLLSKWKPLLLAAIHFDGGKTRYNQFSKHLPISEKILTENLRDLESDGLIRREIFPETPPRVEYQITDAGKATIPVLLSVYGWARKDMARRSLKIDPRGEMFHGYMEPDENIMTLPIGDYIRAFDPEQKED